MKKDILTISLLLIFLSGCNWGEDVSDLGQKEKCNEYEYWEETSNEKPYPGIDCRSGPSKTIGLTFFVYKDNNQYISNEQSILEGVDKINSIYNSHGINFKLEEIKYINLQFPNIEETQSEEDGTTIEYGSGVSLSSLGQEFKDNYNYNNINIVLITDGWGAYSQYPWSNLEYFLTTVRASTLQTSVIPAHELGHALGLLHTHANSNNPQQNNQGNTPGIGLKPVDGEEYSFPVSGPPNWASSAEECYLIEDYTCDTPYDCYNFCEEALGCSGEYLYHTGPSKPGQESDYEDCGSSYSPSLDNLMSRYGDREFLTNDQGARARFYIMYRLNNNLQGNTLKER